MRRPRRRARRVNWGCSERLTRKVSSGSWPMGSWAMLREVSCVISRSSEEEEGERRGAGEPLSGAMVVSIGTECAVFLSK